MRAQGNKAGGWGVGGQDLTWLRSANKGSQPLFLSDSLDSIACSPDAIALHSPG